MLEPRRRGAAGGSRLGGRSARSVPPTTGPVQLIVSGDTAGWIVPCGCTSNQSGGLLRRGTYVASVSGNADVIVADAGGAARRRPRIPANQVRGHSPRRRGDGTGGPQPRRSGSRARADVPSATRRSR